MVESFKFKRIKFRKRGAQKKFIFKVKNKLRMDDNQLAELLGICPRTLREWQKENFYMSFFALNMMCKSARYKVPKNIDILGRYWYVNKGARAGGLAVYKKYGIIGDPEKRRKNWHRWWNRVGKSKKSLILQPFPLKKPKFSQNLAEFVGIMLGDGGMTKYQAKITVHCVDDEEYSEFIVKLIKWLFKLTPGKHKHSRCQVFNIEISRIELVKFCVEKLGLKIGNKVKQQVSIPDWIMENKKFRIACLRGLIDTDGSIIIHKYKSKGKLYVYKKIGFTSRSAPLLNAASEILKSLDIKHGIRGKWEIRIEAQKDVREYFRIIGSHNYKHLKRYEN